MVLLSCVVLCCVECGCGGFVACVVCLVWLSCCVVVVLCVFVVVVVLC